MYKEKVFVEGKGGISAKIIADSISPQGVRITTYELEYPRFCHAEFMTHRMLSKNAASSRAIPVKRAIELILERTAMPIHWGKNQPGMSAKEECNAMVWTENAPSEASEKMCWNTRENIWKLARNFAISFAKSFDSAGYHKQIVNRLLEPFTFIKVVCTATEYDNLFWLRCHPDAQPEFQELANCMYIAREQSVPQILLPGMWHTPYYENGFWASEEPGFSDLDSYGFKLSDALAVSSSCCAQVSYRRLDDSLEKAKDVYKRLVESKPVHASPFEHQATPIKYTTDPETGLLVHKWDVGITHMDRYNSDWSGNLRGWIQHRQLIPGNVCNHYVR